MDDEASRPVLCAPALPMAVHLYLFAVVVEGERAAVRAYIESVRAMRWQK